MSIKDADNMAASAAKLSKETVTAIIDAVKEFFDELFRPNMTIEKIAEVASPRLDEIIENNADKGLKYTAGKFKIKYLDKGHFALEFEMYFKDDAGKWYKAANESEPRDATLLEPGDWKKLQTLKAIEFPIGAPNEEEVNDAAAETVEISEKTSKSNEVTLDKLLNEKKTSN